MSDTDSVPEPKRGEATSGLEHAITMARIITILKKIPVFAGLTDEEYEYLINVCHVIQCPEGEQLFEEGAAGHDLFVLLAGSLEITTTKAGTITTLKPGEIVGEIALVCRVNRTATAVAAQESALLKLSRAELDLLLGRAPRASYVIMKNIAETLGARLMGADTRLAGTA